MLLPPQTHSRPWLLLSLDLAAHFLVPLHTSTILQGLSVELLQTQLPPLVAEEEKLQAFAVLIGLEHYVYC